MCAFFVEGRCPFEATTCAFAHNVTELRQSPDLTKTKLCVATCDRSRCQYAHTVDELRGTDLYYKSRLCRFFEKQGKCNLGDKCRFAHGDQELRTPSTGSSSVGGEEMIFTPTGWMANTRFFRDEVYED